MENNNLESNNSPDILSIRMERDGSWFTLRCTGCGHTFETSVTTIGGIAVVQARCARCNTVNEVWPEDYKAALERCLTQKSPGDMGKLTSEATRITENWYRCEPLRQLLEYEGVNLGEGAERELMAIVVQGLLEASKEGNVDHG